MLHFTLTADLIASHNRQRAETQSIAFEDEWILNCFCILMNCGFKSSVKYRCTPSERCFILKFHNEKSFKLEYWSVFTVAACVEPTQWGRRVFNGVCVKWKDEKMTHSMPRLGWDANQTRLNRFLVFISHTHTHTLLRGLDVGDLACWPRNIQSECITSAVHPQLGRPLVLFWSWWCCFSK